jgi:hypothetical protein
MSLFIVPTSRLTSFRDSVRILSANMTNFKTEFTPDIIQYGNNSLLLNL